MSHALDRCRHYEGAEEGFWPLFTEALASAVSARHLLILRRTLEPQGPWQPFAAWPAKEKFPLGVPLDDPGLNAVIEAAIREEIGEFRPPADPKTRLPVVQIDAGLPGQQHVVLFRFDPAAPAPEDFPQRIARVLDLPLLYRRTRALRLASEDNRAFAQVFDLLGLLDRQTRFVPAAMTF